MVSDGLGGEAGGCPTDARAGPGDIEYVDIDIENDPPSPDPGQPSARRPFDYSAAAALNGALDRLAAAAAAAKAAAAAAGGGADNDPRRSAAAGARAACARALRRCSGCRQALNSARDSAGREFYKWEI